MKRTLGIACAMALMTAGSTHAAVFTQWNFNSSVADANPATGVTVPSIGSGTASLLGVTATFASGDASGGSSDPSVGDDSGWNLTGWAAQGAGSGTRGAEYASSTAGFQDILLSFDLRHSNTSSRFLQVSYSTDGVAFSSLGLLNDGIFAAAVGDVWNNLRTVDFTSIAAVNNNANFKVRITTIFDPASAPPGSYTASSTGSSYGTTSTYRFDMVTFSGNAVPEPGTLGLLAIGALSLIRRRG